MADANSNGLPLRDDPVWFNRVDGASPAHWSESFKEWCNSPLPSNVTPPDERHKVYFARRERDGAIKIGISGGPRERIKAIQNAELCRVELLAVIPKGGRRLERELHDYFWEHRIYGEWFRPCPKIMKLIEEFSRYA